MGGPWTYADDGHDTDGMHGADREYYESITDGLGCGIVGRNDATGTKRLDPVGSFPKVVERTK